MLMNPHKALTAFPEQRFRRVFDCFFCPEKLPFSCRKGPAGLQQRPYGSATGRSLHCNKGPVATPGGPRGGPTLTLPKGRGAGTVHKRLKMNKLQKQRFFRRKNGEILTFARFENLGAWRKNFRKCPQILALNS